MTKIPPDAQIVQNLMDIHGEEEYKGRGAFGQPPICATIMIPSGQFVEYLVMEK